MVALARDTFVGGARVAIVAACFTEWLARADVVAVLEVRFDRVSADFDGVRVGWVARWDVADFDFRGRLGHG